ncbi:DUF4340 domain-containing protein [Anaerolineales bacterium HSG6]|nr:DUF4340 domain-containing protein [Anaerolineales bacterium HSG6]
MSQLNKILAIVFAIQIAIVGFVFWSQTATTQTATDPLIADFEPNEVVGLVISDGEGNSIHLQKEGETWLLASADGYPVQGEKVLPVLEKIPNLTRNRLVAKTDTSHNRLQVGAADFNRLLELTLADGTGHKLYLGSSGGVGATHVRTDDQVEVYLSGEINPFEVNAQPSNWVDTVYFTVPQSATQQIKLENSNGTFQFDRVDDETWAMSDLAGDELFNQVGVTTMFNQLSPLRLVKPLGTENKPEYGLDNPQATVTIEADEPYTMLVGNLTPDEQGYYLKASNSPYYVQVAKFTGDNLINKVRTDFLETPPAEEAPVGPLVPTGE